MYTKDKIRRLIEERRMMATKNQVAQKLIRIAKSLGKPIVSTVSSAHRLPDQWQSGLATLDPSGEILQLDVDEEWVEYDRGYFYDGLKCGINLCVTCLTADDRVVEVKATYNGYLVYLEVEGEIRAYAPFSRWEDAMNMFNEAAVMRERDHAVKEKTNRMEKRQKKFKEFWQAFKNLWGY